MNNLRRKEIKKIIERIKDIQSDIEIITDDEQYYYDNIPENLQSSFSAERSECALESLSDASESVSDLIKNLEEALL